MEIVNESQDEADMSMLITNIRSLRPDKEYNYVMTVRQKDFLEIPDPDDEWLEHYHQLNSTLCFGFVIKDLTDILEYNKICRATNAPLRDMYTEQIDKNYVLVLLHYFMEIGFGTESTYREKIIGVHAAQLYLLLTALPIQPDDLFHPHVFAKSLNALKVVCEPEEDVTTLENLIIGYIHMLKYLLTEEYMCRCLKDVARSVSSLTEIEPENVIVEFDGLEETNRRLAAYAFFLELARINTEECCSLPVVLDVLSQILLNTYDTHKYQFEPLLPRQFLALQNTSLNYILYLYKKLQPQFPSVFLEYTEQFCLMSYESPNNAEVPKYVGHLHSHLLEPEYQGFLQWYFEILVHHDADLRFALHSIMMSLLFKPEHKTKEQHVALIQKMYHKAVEACLDEDEEVSKLAVNNVSVLFMESENQYVVDVLKENFVFKDQAPAGKRLMQIVECLCNNNTRRPTCAASLATIVYHAFFYDYRWIVNKAITILCKLYENGSMTLQRKMLVLTASVYRVYPCFPPMLKLYVHFIVNELVNAASDHKEFVHQDLFTAIYDSLKEEEFRRNAWLLLTHMCQKNLDLKAILNGILPSLYDIQFMVPVIFEKLDDADDTGWQVLAALADSIPNLKATQGHKILFKTLNLFGVDPTSKVTTEKLVCFKELVRYYPVEMRSVVVEVLKTALIKSEIETTHVPAAIHTAIAMSGLSDENMGASPILVELLQCMEKRVFNNIASLVKDFSQEAFHALLRDLCCLGYASLKSSVPPDATTYGLLALFVTPANHGGLIDFFEAYPKVWATCIQCYGRLCLRDEDKIPLCVQVLHSCIHTPYPEVQVQAILVLHDICAVYHHNVYTSMKEDLFYLLGSRCGAVRMAAFEILVELHEKAYMQLEEMDHLHFLLALVDEDRKVAELAEHTIDEKFCENHSSLLITNIVKTIFKDNSAHINPLYICDSKVRPDILTPINKRRFYYMICVQFPIEHKLTMIGYIVRMFIDAYCDEAFSGTGTNYSLLLTESFFVLLSCLPHVVVEHHEIMFSSLLGDMLSMKWEQVCENRENAKQDKKRMRLDQSAGEKKSCLKQSILEHLMLSLKRLWNIINPYQNMRIAYGVMCILINLMKNFPNEVTNVLVEDAPSQTFLENVSSFIMDRQFGQAITALPPMVYCKPDKMTCLYTTKAQRDRKIYLDNMKRKINQSYFKYL